MLLVVAGCATYSDSVREAQQDLSHGRPESAMNLINKHLDTESHRDLPEDLEDERVLLLLERGTLLQSLGEYKLAARDMMVADQRLEWLDLDDSDDIDLAKYMYSDDATAYRAPAYERLLLNMLNMVNFLAIRDWSGARVEARRFTILETFFLDENSESLLPGTLAVGNYLGGVTFEGSRDYSMAARYYSRAWHFGIRTPTLRRRLVALYRVTGYSAKELEPQASGLDAIREQARADGPLRAKQYRREFVDGNVILLVQTGLAPYKVPERIPIGLAMTYAASHHYHSHRLSPSEQTKAQRLAVEGALKWVNFPSLTSYGVPHGRSARVYLDGQQAEIEAVVSVAEQVRVAWEDIRGPLIASAITRLITRVVAGQATRMATSSIAKSQGSRGSTAGALGWLAGLAIEGAMTAADTPDTRSWTTLPATLRIARFTPNPGNHEIVVDVDGRQETQMVAVPRSGMRILNFSRYR